MMRGTSVVVGLLSVFCAADAAAANRAFAKTGSLSVKTDDLAQAPVATKVVRPSNASATTPVVVASHGWSASGDQQLGWAEHFASWGFVVAVPTFDSPYSPDYDANEKVIVDLVKQLAGAGTKVGLEGHSAGGLATALAAVDRKPDAVVLFDPVDNADRGKTAFPSIASPTLVIFAAPSSCNNQSGWKSFVTSTKAPLLAFDVKGSTHCDGENAPRGLCGIACGGGADAGRQSAYAHYATAFLLANLLDDAAAKAALAAADGDAELSGVIRPNDAAQVPDAGASSSSSSSSGAASSSSSGSAGSADPSSDGPASADADSDGGGGCSTGGESAGRGALFALACLALGVAARRRRHARG